MADRWVCRSCWASNEAGWNRCVECRTTRSAENPAEGPLSGDEPRSLWSRIPGGFGGLLGILLMLSSIGFAGANAVDRDAEGTIVGSGRLHVGNIRVGDCFDFAEDQEQDEFFEVMAVPCDGPHLHEAFHATALQDAPFYPSPDTVLAHVVSDCFPVFEEYVGRDYESSVFDVNAFGPTEAGWRDGDRSLLCVIQSLDGTTPLVGSARGSDQ